MAKTNKVHCSERMKNRYEERKITGTSIMGNRYSPYLETI